MKYKIGIEGLDCPNCAKALENEFNKIDNINNANIDFINQKLSFETDNFDLSIQKMKNTISQVEPSAKLIIEKEKKKTELTWVYDVVLLFLGIAVGLCALLISMPTWAFWLLFVISAVLLGYKTYLKAVLLLFKGKINENLLITLAVIGAAALGEYMEALMVVALYTIGKILENLAVNKSRKSIEKLTKLQPEYAVIIENGNEKRVNPNEVKLGNKIIVKAGERVPLDGVISEGSASIDVQSLTGESLPVNLKTNDEILSGSIILDGVLYITVTKEYQNSTINKIIFHYSPLLYNFLYNSNKFFKISHLKQWRIKFA